MVALFNVIGLEFVVKLAVPLTVMLPETPSVITPPEFAFKLPPIVITSLNYIALSEVAVKSPPMFIARSLKILVSCIATSPAAVSVLMNTPNRKLLLALVNVIGLEPEFKCVVPPTTN